MLTSSGGCGSRVGVFRVSRACISRFTYDVSPTSHAGYTRYDVDHPPRVHESENRVNSRTTHLSKAPTAHPTPSFPAPATQTPGITSTTHAGPPRAGTSLI